MEQLERFTFYYCLLHVTALFVTPLLIFLAIWALRRGYRVLGWILAACGFLIVADPIAFFLMNPDIHNDRRDVGSHIRHLPAE